MLGNSPISCMWGQTKSLIFRQKSQCTLLREMVRFVTVKCDSGYLGVNPNVDRSMGLFCVAVWTGNSNAGGGHLPLLRCSQTYFIYWRLQYSAVLSVLFVFFTHSVAALCAKGPARWLRGWLCVLPVASKLFLLCRNVQSFLVKYCSTWIVFITFVL